MLSSLKSRLWLVCIVVILIASGMAYLFLEKKQVPGGSQITDEYVALPDNHKVHVFHGARPEKGLLIFVVDKIRDEKTIEYGRQLASLSYYVATIDNESLTNLAANAESHCVDLAKEIIDVGNQVKKRYRLENSELPILMGLDKAAATVYAALSQSVEHTFHAAIGINFSAALQTTNPLCGQEHFSTLDDHGLKLDPVKRLPVSFYVFQDAHLAAESARFAKNIGNLKLTIADEPQQNSRKEAIQILQWLDPRLADQISSDASGSDLPLIEVPADIVTGQPANTDSLVVLLTGDGGWAAIDKSIAKILAAKGIPTVALDSLSYFWKARTPEETAKDIENTITQYLNKWNRKRVILIGYSFGADVLPFVANNLTTETQQKVSLVALLGMGKTAAFEFRLSSWMNADKNPNRLPIIPELRKMKWAKSVCIYGVDDDAANCLPTAELGVGIISMSGDHHFDEKYDELVQHILDSEKIQ